MTLPKPGQTKTVLVRLVPPNKKGQGRFITLKDHQERTYYCGGTTPPTDSGVYQVTLSCKGGTYGRFQNELFFLDAYTRAIPNGDTEALAFLHATAGEKTAAEAARVHAEDVRAGGDEANRPLSEKVADSVWLQTLRGIGAKRSEAIAKAVGKSSATERRLVALLDRWGIPTSTSKRFQWAVHVLESQPHVWEELEVEPGVDREAGAYTLCRLNDKGWEPIRRAAQSVKADGLGRPTMTPRSYPFVDVDRAVLQREPDLVDHPRRVAYAVRQALDDRLRQGDSGLEPSDVVDAAYRVGAGTVTFDPSEGALPVTDTVLQRIPLYEAGVVRKSVPTKAGPRVIYATSEAMRWAEVTSKEIVHLRSTKSPFPENLAARMEARAVDTATLAGITLTREQLSAVRQSVGSCVSAVTGPAGSGKSATLQAIVAGLALATIPDKVPDVIGGGDETSAFNLVIIAPTGAAAARMRRGLVVPHPKTSAPLPIVSTADVRNGTVPLGSVAVGTLHSFLGFTGNGWKIPDAQPTIALVDETSMADEEAVYALARYASKCRRAGVPLVVVLSGDENQLPPVGPGFPFRDMVAGPYGAVVPTARLTVVQRQAGQSRIVQAGHAVLNKTRPLLTSEQPDSDTDFWWNERVGDVSQPHKVPQMIEAFVSWLQTTPAGDRFNEAEGRRPEFSDVQLVLPLRNPSKVEFSAPCVNTANPAIQAHVSKVSGNPIKTVTIEVDVDGQKKTYRREFAVGDRVVHTGPNGFIGETPRGKRSEPIMRGTTGTVVHIGAASVSVAYPDTSVVYVGPEELGHVSLAWANTCHSLQGSEFDFTIVHLPDRAGPGLIDRPWLYTALTRAKKGAMLVGPVRRVEQAVSTSSGMARKTALSVLLH